MALSQERIGQIAMLALQKKMGQDGIRLNWKEIKRDITNEAKSLGIPAPELAEFAKILIKDAFDKTMTELNSITQ